ncbi:spore germination protein [Tepidimicrobium xylanilyticum]|uniref:spore germination protein n=1 Tax=Tepidimicrobium xylanilyticum TaxID=1123352 RepID=UPI00264FE680|nr:spore germination protein [Tepidimicrobium xylanilyticum]GMG96999.1 spore germination protein [Tepidimicrobium xylanilyticum]
MISKSVSFNREEITKIFNNSCDFVAYEFETRSNIRILICFIEGFVNEDLFDRDILRPLILQLDDPKNLRKVIFTPKIQIVNSMEEVKNEIVYGKVAIFVEGNANCYVVELTKWDKRMVEEPNSEAVVRGPKEGFIEDIEVNKVLLRRKLRNNNLVFEDYKYGKQTNTKVSIAYIKGIVNEDVLKELKRRLEKIDVDSILESGYIEELIEDDPFSLMGTVSNVEKPDIVAGKLLEGRVAILVDGTPHVLTVPRILVEGIMVSEDYYIRPFYATFLRLLRGISIFISVYLPGTFVALQLYHQEMIPTVLLINMAGAREGVPLPVMLEVLIMILALELIKESGLRLPKSVGTTVSIVGALILGQAAVEAGVVNAITLIVVSTAAIAEFVVPGFMEGIVIYRLFILFLAGIMGLYGIACGFVFINMQLVSLDSFGVPYTWPIAPREWDGFKKDTFVRLPLWKRLFRPRAIAKRNVRRQISPWRK